MKDNRYIFHGIDELDACPPSAYSRLLDKFIASGHVTEVLTFNRNRSCDMWGASFQDICYYDPCFSCAKKIDEAIKPTFLEAALLQAKKNRRDCGLSRL